ncbi:MAG: mandelate racemase/muconate lactonizing enzyme family protein, partial [Acetobacteraceae bacterium]|nr:mandelate racemase/muconate lactonizing enzyme family protein [Acetobacteraceae bacterium]
GNRTVYPTTDRSILVRVRTQSGVVGWGETYGLIAPRATVEIIEDLLAPFTLGRDARDPAVIHDDLRDLMRVRGATGGFYGDALAAIDIAIWDAASRAAGLPLCRLLGGCRRDRIAAYFSGLPAPSLAQRVDLAAEWQARGFTFFKFAAAVSDEGERAELQALRERLGPTTRIGVDLHWRHTAGEALSLLARLAPHDPFFAEAPVASDDIAALRTVAARSPVPIAAGEEWYARSDAAARLPGLAIVQPEMGHTGVTEFMRIAELAEAQGATVMPHATVGLGIFLAASLHAAAALRSATLHEYQQSIFDRNVGFLEGDLRLEGTEYVVPAGPGIGVIPAKGVWRHAG